MLRLDPSPRQWQESQRSLESGHRESRATDYSHDMHLVAVAAFDGVVPFDLSVPCEVFGRVRLPNGEPGYEVRVCAAAQEIHAGAFTLRTRWRLGDLSRADTVILPGVSDSDAAIPPALVRAVRRAAERRSRIASICSGAFVLAATGLLDGLRATTHWLAADELTRRYPNITVDRDVLYVDNGQILTSAGAAAGLDLCLHMVRRDYGAAVAVDAARLAVMPLERAGGQSQFIVHEPPGAEGASLEPVMRWIEEHVQQSLTLERIARRAAMSTRTLSRRFAEQAGTTPLQWVLHSRVRRAQHLLETTGHSIERIAMLAGFGSTPAFRDRFRRVVGTSPQGYRQAFKAADRP
jgi:transcriptional regulator GlxA family with amidase domain